MAYSTDDIKALAAILKPIIKSALESGSTGVGDLEVVTSLDSVYSLPALRMPGGIHDVVEAPLSLLRVNLRVTTTHVQWKLGNGEWKDLLALSELGGGLPGVRRRTSNGRSAPGHGRISSS